MLIYRLFSNPIKEKIFKSPYFKEIRTYDLNQTITEAQQLSSIGSLVYGSPHQFICLLQKLESLNIGDSIILEKYHEALKGDNSSFVMFFVFYIRMTVRMKGDFEEIRRNLCSDESLINIIDENNEHYTITIKEMLNMLQNDSWLAHPIKMLTLKVIAADAEAKNNLADIYARTRILRFTQKQVI